MMRNFVVGAALGCALLGCITTTAKAQDPILSQLYGSGVHEYFSGGYLQSIADLTEAIDGGTKDPRVYYFRALSWFRMGDTTKAKTDLAAGAKLESADVNQFYPVSKSLERVQGADRLKLERYRVEARAEAYRRQERRNLARYEAQRKAEAEVLRSAPVPPAPGDSTPPAAADTKPGAKPPAEEPAASPPADDADPFADDPAASSDEDKMPGSDTTPAEGDADAAAPEDEMPADEPSEDDAADSEGMDKDADSGGMGK